MKKILLSLILTTTLFSCGKKQPEISSGEIISDYQLDMYVQKFKKMATECFNRKPKYSGLRVSYVPNFTDKKGVVTNTAGKCTFSSGEEKATIQISSKFWKKFSPNDPTNNPQGFPSTRAILEKLMFHEMAHCYFDADHVDNPDAIMNHELKLDENYYIQNYKALMEEMFGATTTCDLEFDDDFYMQKEEAHEEANAKQE